MDEKNYRHLSEMMALSTTLEENESVESLKEKLQESSSIIAKELLDVKNLGDSYFNRLKGSKMCFQDRQGRDFSANGYHSKPTPLAIASHIFLTSSSPVNLFAFSFFNQLDEIIGTVLVKPDANFYRPLFVESWSRFCQSPVPFEGLIDKVYLNLLFLFLNIY